MFKKNIDEKTRNAVFKKIEEKIGFNSRLERMAMDLMIVMDSDFQIYNNGDVEVGLRTLPEPKKYIGLMNQ